MHPLKENPSLNKKRKRGFSVLEVMIATAVLGIAMAGLVKLHRAAIRGMKTTNDITVAEDIAEQVADEVAAQDPATLPTATNGVASTCNVPGGCKAGGGGFQRAFGANKPANCTFWVNSAGTARRGTTGQMDNAVIISTQAAAITAGANYRVDKVVMPHPSPSSKGTIVDVYTCWLDEGQIVREVHTRRVVGP